MASPQITTLKDLHHYLHIAMQLEHATIPPYLLALYSIHPGTNTDATHIIRTVVVEEMLHLTLAANILNAVGGTPDLTTPDFVPSYPTPLPDGEKDFKVDLRRFSRDAVETFLKIERPGEAPHEDARVVRRSGPQSIVSKPLEDNQLHYYSIGEFYAEIAHGINYLTEDMGENRLFTGNESKQVTSEYYYSGGGELMPVQDRESACAAIDLISGQGEGLGGEIYNKEHELAHYYRFEQLKLGRYYQPGDRAGDPSGPPLNVDWDAVYPIETNPRIKDYDDPELYQAAVSFNQSYAQFLATLTKAFNGEPHLLLDAVPQMFRLREKITRLIHNPIPGKRGVNAAPTFELAALAER